MKKSEVRSLFYEGLQGVLSKYGFRLNKKAEGFVRPIPEGKQTIGVPLVDYNPVYILSLTVTTRLNAVEDIFNLISGSPTMYHSMTVTTITQLDYFTKKSKADTEYSVTTEAETSNAIRNLTPIIQAKIIPFLDQHQDVVTWDKAVNSKSNNVCGDGSLLTDRCNSVDNSNHPYRGMHAVILAHLAGNPDFEQIVTRPRDFYKESHEADEKLSRLADHLRKR